ncbi:DNA polymerase III subunit epsilon [Rugosimonospora africana]|uniref:DNA polymerase III subunit epsilon n=1 Tax=Rugosimonospora africana TaxID=556532 RepID=A0A8J3QZQ2_9ACTN|nr:DEDD exonuclease domain-containing protein [Rugosimonospora africana]GIH18710.1 DNA polymerase III subunit epsilon [Rugosimonospora africana]
MPSIFVQQTIDQLLDDPEAHSLRDTTFVVVDLETTGGRPEDCGITEIGAVKTLGGEELGEFATLVNPGQPIPPYVTVLTGITSAMLAPAPPLTEVIPAFLEFARGAVWVAHNAPYDVGFLKAACARFGYPWPHPKVLDTAALARRALTRDEVPNRKLATLAAFFRTRVPSHRALADARATVDVLHGLFARLGGHKVFTLGEAIEFARAVSPVQRSKRHLGEGLPDTPGVYVFRALDDRPLYVGTSRSIATRVKSYFTAAEKRARITEMLAAATRVEAIECAHSLEAEVRELRLIGAHKPPYNRRSKFPERVHWLKLTAEAYPRLSVVRQLAGDAASYLGPFSSTKTAELAAAAVYDALPLRQCTHKLSVRTPRPACALAELGRCPAPCEHHISVESYDADAAQPFRTATAGDPGPLVEALLARIDGFAAGQRYEEAGVLRGRLGALLRATIRMQRLHSLTVIAELVAARPAAGGGWELAVVRHGRLVAAGTSAPRVHPQPTIDALLATAETVRPGPGPTPCASAEESERVLAWLEKPDARLVEVSEGWALPATGAGRFRDLLAKVERATNQPYVQHHVTDRSSVDLLG